MGARVSRHSPLRLESIEDRENTIQHLPQALVPNGGGAVILLVTSMIFLLIVPGCWSAAAVLPVSVIVSRCTLTARPLLSAGVSVCV